VAEAFDIVFWPVAVDAKVRDVEKMPDGSIDVCLFNGSVRTSEQEYMARLLRQKSKVLVAFGSCAFEGCIPGLANMNDRREIFDTAYRDTPRSKAALGLIHKGHKGQVNEGLLNMVEMAFRAYDPCFGCATHSLPGRMPLEVTLRGPDGEVLRQLSQFVDGDRPRREKSPARVDQGGRSKE